MVRKGNLAEEAGKKMTRKWITRLLGLTLVLGACTPAAALQQEKPAYTMAEYNAYQACAKETSPQQKVKCLDDFVSKFPNSALLPYIYQLYFDTYNQLKDCAKVIQYADKLMGMGNKIDPTARLNLLYHRSLCFHSVYSDKAPDAQSMATQAREAALEGLKVMPEVKKPEGVPEDQFEQGKKLAGALFHYTAGFASLQLKDYKSAIDDFQAALADNPTDALTYFRLGVAYLQMEPPQSMDGFWALARSVGLKGPGEGQVRAYLRGQLVRYEQPTCEKLLDAQMNELITLAANSPERPATYRIPSAADLQKAREETTNFIADLKAGGEKAKLIWLSTCGLEFPEVVGKVLEVNPRDDGVVLKVFTGATPEETEAGTTPNMDVKVEGQPGVKRLQKDDYIRFSGTLVGYDPEPFMLHWDKAKVNPEDIPEEKVRSEGRGEHEPVTGDQCRGQKGAKLISCLQPDRRVDVEVRGTREVAGAAAPSAGAGATSR